MKTSRLVLSIALTLCFWGCNNASDTIYHEPKAMIDIDLNGDGKEDIVQVYVLYPSDSEVTEDEIIEAPSYIPNITATISGKEYRVDLTQRNFYAIEMMPYNLSDSSKAVIASLDTGGTGAGTKELYAVYFDGQLKFLPVPIYNQDNRVGFMAEVNYLNDYKAELVCGQTGYKEVFDLVHHYEDADPAIYDSMGVLINDNHGNVDCIFNVEVVSEGGKDAIKLSQYIWGQVHNDSLGVFETTFIWNYKHDSNGIEVLGQNVLTSKLTP